MKLSISARRCLAVRLCAAWVGTAVAISPAAAERKVSAPIASRSAMVMSDPVGSFAPMLSRVIPAVVSILVTGETPEPVELEPRDADGRAKPLPAPGKHPFRSGGSGVIVDRAQGLIITNNHVIEDALRLEVSLSDGRRMTARLLGRDIGTDIAVLQVDDRDLPALPLGNSDKARVGDVVAAVGNPFGLEGTATLGIVSALMRTEIGHGAFEDFMQIDASINPGNSGGALVDVHGELIGINTAGPGEGGKASGIGFAIPINMASTIMKEIVAHGRMQRGALGLVVEDLSFDAMMAMNKSVTRGARIIEVVANSPAANAGIKPGAIVVGISGKPVRSAAEYYTRVETVPLGTKLDTVIHRGSGGDTTVSMVTSQVVVAPTISELPAAMGALAGAGVAEIVPGNPLFGDLRGAQIATLPKESRAYALGLEVGDVIVELDGTNVTAPDDLVRLARRAGMLYRVKIIRNGVPALVRVAH